MDGALIESSSNVLLYTLSLQVPAANLSRESREALAFEAASAFPVNGIDHGQLPAGKSLPPSRHARWLILRAGKG